MNKIKLLFLVPTLNIAGAEKVCLNICDNLNFDDYEVSLVSISNQIPLWETVRNKDKIHFYTLNEQENIGFPWFSIKAIKKLSRLINKINPYIIHSHLWGIKCLYLFSLISLKNKSIFIATIHSSDFIYTSKKFTSRLFKAIENATYKFYNFHLVSISDSVNRMINKELYYNTITQIENGIDTNLFVPSTKRTTRKLSSSMCFPVLVHVGRGSETKRQVDIINAVKILKLDYPNIKLLLVGRDNEKLYGELVKKMDLTQNINFIPPNDKVYVYLKKADIGIFPSLFEGLSLAFAEMMSCGLPLIITDIPSLTEMTNYKESAEIVPLKCPEAIADRVKYLLNNPEISTTKGEKARELAVKKYSLHVMIQKYSDLYNSLYSKLK